MTLLDINASKIKAENEVAQLKTVISKKDGEIQSIAGELLKMRKQNETLEELLVDMQTKLDAKDKESKLMEANM